MRIEIDIAGEDKVEVVALVAKLSRVLAAVAERHSKNGHATKAARDKCSLCQAMADITTADYRAIMALKRLATTAAPEGAGVTR